MRSPADVPSKKKPVRPSVASARKPTAGPARARRSEEPTPAPAAASGTPTLRLLFDSPISEGHVMVAVNENGHPAIKRMEFSVSQIQFSDSQKRNLSMTLSLGAVVSRYELHRVGR